MKLVRRLLRVLFWILIALLVLAFFMRDRLPQKQDVLSELSQAPIQEETTLDPFRLEVDGTVYTISPLYTYDIVGLVVSEHHADSVFDYYHDLWGDSINIKDVCVVWGTNALSGLYADMKFKSGSWTCYYGTRNPVTWRLFAEDEVSNNHLLTSSPEIAQALRTVRRGDQIRIKGYLVNYSHDGGFERGTSITRTDTGNGACETIYISEIEVLREANPLWRNLYTFSATLLIIVALLRPTLAFVALHSRSTIKDS